MSTKKVIFRMENCEHLPVEVCGVLDRFVRKSTQAGNFFCADVRNISICRSAVVCREVCGRLQTSMRTSLRMSMRTSAWIGADVCGCPHGWVRMSAEDHMDRCGHPQVKSCCPCCVITCWSYVVLHDHMQYDLVFNVYIIIHYAKTIAVHKIRMCN